MDQNVSPLFRVAFASTVLLAAFAGLLASPAVSAAQTGIGQGQPGQRTHPAIERYNRTAKGKDVEEWKRRLTDEDVRKRLEAVDSLGTKGGEAAIRPLIEAMADSDYRVRTRAIDYLGMMQAAEAAPVLMQSLFLSDVGREEKLRALTALGRIADPSTSDRLLAYATTIEDNELATRAVYAVGEIGRADARPRVEALRGSRPGTEMDRLVDDALAKIDQRASIRPVEQPTLLELEKKLAPPKQQGQ